MSSVNTKSDVEQQRAEEPAGRGTSKALVAIALLLCLAIGIGVGIGIGAGIWKDGSSSTSTARGNLEALFDRVDGNEDGSISVDELVADVAAHDNVTLNETEAQKTLSLLDSDGDGELSRDEFVNGAGDETLESLFGFSASPYSKCQNIECEECVDDCPPQIEWSWSLGDANRECVAKCNTLY